MNSEQIDEIFCVAKRDAEDRLRAGEVVDVLDEHDDLARLYSLIVERAQAGDVWAISQAPRVHARLRGVSAALGVEI